MNPELSPLDHERRMERQRLGWSLAALAAMAAPHVPNIAAWITAVALLLAFWRVACAWRGWKLPSRRLLIALAIGELVCVLLTYRTINGPEPGAALLLLLATLKLMESKGFRDYFLVLVTAYFLGLANFLYDQTVPLALYMIPAVWFTTMALLNIAHPDSDRRLKVSAFAAGRLLLPALPLAAVLFLLFPRIAGPLWGFASQKHSGVTGLTTSMTPGDMSQLAQSDEIAFRVKFDGPPPPLSALYWRALVLHDYDGQTWSSGNLPWRRQLDVTPHGQPLAYSVTLEPTNLSLLYSLDLPSKLPEDTSLSASYEITTRTPVTERKLYSATSYTDYSYGSNMPGWMLHRDLQLPANRDPRTHALAQQWRGTGASQAEIVQDALRMFHDQNFSYTLQPGTLPGDDRIDQFLFNTRRGFCEHYAGAFVYLMRAAGIPAHVVIGYQGGELNPLDGYYVVRQREAHAWAEVWLPERGWTRVDPTGAVDPARVEKGLEASLPEEAASFYTQHPWFGEIRYSWDALNTGWNEWVLAYGPELQSHFFKKVGLDYGDWLQLALVLGGCILLTVLGFWLYLLWERRRPAAAPVLRDYARFCARLAKLGFKREAHEGPLNFAMRVARARPDLEREVLAITDCYIELRYLDEGDGREFNRLVRMFKPSRPRPA